MFKVHNSEGKIKNVLQTH